MQTIVHLRMQVPQRLGPNHLQHILGTHFETLLGDVLALVSPKLRRNCGEKLPNEV